MAHREPLLDPTGDADGRTDARLAPRPRSLAGLRVGLVDNSKPNASAFLTEVANELRRGCGVGASTMYVKSYFGTPIEASEIRRIVGACDFVVAGIGD